MSTTLVKPYTTLERLKNECRLKLTDTSHDDWLKTCINDASRMVDRVVVRPLWQKDYTQESPYRIPPEYVLDDTLYLPFPIIALDAIMFGDDKTVVHSSDYDWRNADVGVQGAVIRFEQGITDTHWYRQFTQRRDVKVYLSGSVGYAATEGQTTPPETLPFEIVRAATIIAAAITGMFMREQIGYDGVRTTVTDSRIPDEAWKLLKPFKLLVH